VAITPAPQHAREYVVSYSHASLLAHPGIFTLDSVIAERGGVVVPSDGSTVRQAEAWRS
jgi:hypothetical protein